MDRQWLIRRLRASRAFSLPASVLPVLLATSIVRPWRQWNWSVLAASMAGAALLHLAGNLFNDYYDFLSGVDRKLEGDEGRPGRLLVRGEMTPAQVLHLALFCLAAALPLTLWLAWRVGWGLLAFAAAAVAGLYAYTGPPLRLKYRALGEAVIFVVFGPLLMLGAAFAQTAQLEWRVLLLSLPAGLATTAILTGNNLRDEQEDRSAGIRTIAGLLGRRGAGWAYLALVISAATLQGALGLAGLAPRVLAASPLLLVLLLGPMRAVLNDQRLSDIDARTARFVTALLAFAIAALVLTN